MSVKLLKAFKQYHRWEIVDRDEKYPYVMNNSQTYMDKTTKAKFEVYKAGTNCAIYYYGIGVCTDPEVVSDFVEGVHKLLVESKLKELDELYANTNMSRGTDIAPRKLSVSSNNFNSKVSEMDRGHLLVMVEDDKYKYDRDGFLYYDMVCRFFPNM
jgi:hypothetical protein